jgi:hypothetical protein
MRNGAIEALRDKRSPREAVVDRVEEAARVDLVGDGAELARVDTRGGPGEELQGRGGRLLPGVHALLNVVLDRSMGLQIVMT